MKAERAKVRAGGKVRDKAVLGVAGGQRQGRVKAEHQATGHRGHREETGQRLGRHPARGQGSRGLSSGDAPSSEQSPCPVLRWCADAFCAYHPLGRNPL